MQTVVLHFLPYKFFQAVFVRSIRERESCSIHCYMIIKILTTYLYLSLFIIICKSISPYKRKSIPLSIYTHIHQLPICPSICPFLLQSQLIINMNEGCKYFDYFLVSYSNIMTLTTWFLMKTSLDPLLRLLLIESLEKTLRLPS